MLRKLMETSGRGGRGDSVIDNSDLRPGGAGGEGHGGVWGDREGSHPLVTRQLLGKRFSQIAATSIQLLSTSKSENLEAGLCVAQQLLIDNVLPPGRLVGEEARHALWFVCDAAAQGGEYRGGRHQAGRLVAEVVVDGGDGDDVLSLVPQVGGVDGGGQGEAGDDVVEVVEGGCCCQLPPEAAQDQQLTLLHIAVDFSISGGEYEEQ